LTASHKLLLGFDALAISRASGKMPRVGKIIHGRRRLAVTVQLAPQIDRARAMLPQIANQSGSAASLPVVLNKHCAVCEYETRCRQIAVEKDDLSLLPNIGEKERRKQHEKGIFTVTQLSYTFRPRRRSASLPPKHHHALKALAIRKQQIHLLGTPAFELSHVPVYIDVEGDPDRDFYYLIGLRTLVGESIKQYSFWADDPADERDLWAECLRQLSTIDNPRLVHYGSYETQFLKRMGARYPDIGQPGFGKRLTESALNLLPIIYTHVYFPTYSNSLKEIAGYLGFRWSVSPSSGLAALTWRSQWERSRAAGLKQKLIMYNAEDCEGTQRVAEAISALCQGVYRDGIPAAEPVKVDFLKPGYPKLFGVVQFVLPEFAQINQAAYWDYQRNKVYVRSNQRLQRLSRRVRNDQAIERVRPNKIIYEEESPRAPQCNCAAPLIYKWGRFSQIVYDLRWSSAGVRRWVVRYVYARYICWHCKATYYEYLRKPKYGAGLRAFLVYQNIEVQISQSAIASTIRQLFALPMTRGVINKVKADEASRYRGTYKAILERISTGRLVHADETRVKVDGHDAYVWVFTNLEYVAFVFSETREAGTVQEILKDFRGVLVSDFYAGYDSVDCTQQKCLVHLIRDMNDDLCREPFNEEFKELAQRFASLVRPIIESVDRFGLKARHLRKHKMSVGRFFSTLAKANFQTEVALAYRKRFEKNKDKLFTFLDYDGVPWNNNNAEHAIKAFAGLRNCIRGASSVRGMQDYLILLSICETCRYKGVSFLEFLRSEVMDVDAFVCQG